MSEQTRSNQPQRDDSMRRLTGQDAVFVYAETPTMPMHTIGTVILDPSDAPVEDFGYDEIVANIAARQGSRGDEVFVVATDSGLLITPYDPTFEEAMAVYRRGAKKYKNALRELAK